MKKLMSLLASLMLVPLSAMADADPRALIVVTSHSVMGDTDKPTGLWLSEMTHPHHELTTAGIEVDIASIQGGASPIDPWSLEGDDPINAAFLASPETRRLLDNTAKLADVDPADYDAILFAGGHGTVWDFPDSPAVAKIGSAIYAQGGYVAAVCHGPTALLNLRDEQGNLLIDGKRVAGFSNAEEAEVGLTEVVPYLLQDALTAGGALYQEGKMFQPFVVQDDRLITGQNPQSATELGKTLAQALNSGA